MTIQAASSGAIIERDTVKQARQQLLAHPIYEEVNDLPRLRIFMKSHVFAVWDFMSLLKRLQQVVTCCEVPWLPPVDAELARFVNEIVIGEETDEDGRGGFASHFELYRQAMQELDADCGPIDTFLCRLRKGTDIPDALAGLGIAQSAADFVRGTLQMAGRGEPHEVAAAFCYGREDVIPAMFQKLAATLEHEGRPVERLLYYLQRHIELDGDHHGPLAQRLVERLCGDDANRHEQAAAAARQALEARIRLWDGVLAEMKADESSS